LRQYPLVQSVERLPAHRVQRGEPDARIRVQLDRPTCSHIPGPAEPTHVLDHVLGGHGARACRLDERTLDGDGVSARLGRQ
jgi:hypothetical protein